MIIRPSILLHPKIPPPLHGLNPRSILGDGWWNKQRQKAYAAQDYHCWACGVEKTKAKYHKWLEAHECYEFDYGAGTARMIEVTALCHLCHNFIHQGKAECFFAEGKIPKSKYKDIFRHGYKLLAGYDESNNPYMEINKIWIIKKIS